ncbi:hypothetical protein COV18_06650 [Candidatus Woesearchaeota archaeon CG10_big_fil_rev_8_21_14_0_10_37_12]|nr:MAG: hypothetical protein COV18_06650 [Candidatus Woesearchaeota archaeon CG10_big_fil_rev_8_21_14_0_10_37_12]
MTENTLILEELREIKAKLSNIENSMPDRDMFLNAEEAQLLSESFANEKAGITRSSKDLRKELGL